MKNISETYYPDVTRIILVADNLNTHCPGSFYATFPPETAWELMQKFEFHYTPKHGSWLNIAETELGSLSNIDGTYTWDDIYKIIFTMYL